MDATDIARKVLEALETSGARQDGWFLSGSLIDDGDNDPNKAVLGFETSDGGEFFIVVTPA
jgi:hypothetical protein